MVALLPNFMSWLPKIQEAIASNTLVFHCQPIVRLAGFRIQENLCELLVRLPVGSQFVSAYHFIDEAAQDADTILRLDRCAVSYAMKVKEDCVTVNLSSATLRDFTFIAYLEEELKKYGKTVRDISFEITEQDALHEDAIAVIRAIKSMGFQVGLDDFGCGHSSFPALMAVEPDFIKIDGRFIFPLHQDRLARAIVKGLFVLAMELGIDVVAERVETQEIENQILRIKDELAESIRIKGQGWLYGRPGPCK